METQSPLLKRSAKVKNQTSAKVVIDYLDEQITMEGPGAQLFTKLSSLLDGKSSVEQIATKCGEAPSRVEKLLQGLNKANVLTMKSAVNDDDFRMTGLEFYDLHRRYAAHWLLPVYHHPFWLKMTTGQATRAQVVGFAFEKYHYIEGAHEHMAMAAANARPELMPHLARHFIEEYTHGDIYRKGLQSLFRNEQVLDSQPLPSTRALINFLTETAARNSFSYYAGNEVLQMTENTDDKAESHSIDSFYAALRKHYPYTDKLVASFIQHTNADQKLGHAEVFKEMCESISSLTRQEVADAMNVARSMAEHLLLFMDGIDTWYGRHSAIPRAPRTLLSE